MTLSYRESPHFSGPVLRGELLDFKANIASASEAAVAAIVTDLSTLSGVVDLGSHDGLMISATAVGADNVTATIHVYGLSPIFDPADAGDADAQPVGWVPVLISGLAFTACTLTLGSTLAGTGKPLANHATTERFCDTVTAALGSASVVLSSNAGNVPAAAFCYARGFPKVWLRFASGTATTAGVIGARWVGGAQR